MKLLKCKFSSPVAWGIKEDDIVENHFAIYFEFPCTFTVTTMNAAFCSRNLFTALRLSIEHICIKSAKYDALKECIRNTNCWRKL